MNAGRMECGNGAAALIEGAALPSVRDETSQRDVATAQLAAELPTQQRAPKRELRSRSPQWRRLCRGAVPAAGLRAVAAMGHCSAVLNDHVYTFFHETGSALRWRACCDGPTGVPGQPTAAPWTPCDGAAVATLGASPHVGSFQTQRLV